MKFTIHIHHIPTGKIIDSDLIDLNVEQYNIFMKLIKDVAKLEHLSISRGGHQCFIAPKIMQESMLELRMIKEK